MRRRSEPHSIDENLQAERARLEAAFENIERPQRDLLERKLRQIETACHIHEAVIVRAATTEIVQLNRFWSRSIRKLSETDAERFRQEAEHCRQFDETALNSLD